MKSSLHNNIWSKAGGEIPPLVPMGFKIPPRSEIASVVPYRFGGVFLIRVLNWGPSFPETLLLLMNAISANASAHARSPPECWVDLFTHRAQLNSTGGWQPSTWAYTSELFWYISMAR